jgi:hypothetical protein
MSINKQQAQLLADGFLDSIGSSKDELRPRDSYSELIILAGELVEDAQENLKGNVASGALSESLAVDEPTRAGDILRIDITMQFYGRFLNKGVRGTKSGKGLYKFKHELPSKGMVEALKQSIARAGSKVRNTSRAKTTSTNELKNFKVSDADKYAFAAGRNIKMYGIAPTGFVDKAVRSTQKKVSDRLGLALKVDVQDWLKNI